MLQQQVPLYFGYKIPWIACQIPSNRDESFVQTRAHLQIDTFAAMSSRHGKRSWIFLVIVFKFYIRQGNVIRNMLVQHVCGPSH